MSRTIYLDYAAATPMDEAVKHAMEPYFSDNFYNPSANYLAANAVKEEIAAAKKSIAGHLGTKYTEIIHTSGGTEANNLAIAGIMENYPDSKILVSSIEHESVLRPAEQYEHGLIPVDEKGLVKVEKLANFIDDRVILISIMAVNNEVGTIQPVRKIAEIIGQVRKERQRKGVESPLYLHTDACQAPGYLDLHTSRLGVDLLTLNGGKIYGPKGSGILFVKTGIELTPQLLGGGQQRNLRSGTENAASIIGFAKALDLAVKNRHGEAERVKSLRDKFVEGLVKLSPEIIINGHPKHQSPHIAHVSFPGQDNERFLFALDDFGILAASGSACSASSDEPSHVLKAMGISDKLAQSSLRFSFGKDTNEADISKLLSVLAGLL